MEIYKSSAPVVVNLDIPLDPSISGGDVVVARRGNTILHTFVDADFVLPRATTASPLSVRLPLKLVLLNQSFVIDWELDLDGQVYDYATDIDVVSPILPITEVETITGKTGAEAIEAERRVRHLIESITSTRFYPYSAAYKVSNIAGNVLTLPDRLLNLKSLSFNASYSYPIEQLIIGERTITIDPDKWLTIKSDYEGSPGYYQPVVWNPYRHNAFSPRIVYVVDGTWGYGTTPSAVALAARMLLKDFECSEDVWRQRGLESIAMGDTRIEFGPNVGTGNVDVDRLLGPYRKSEMFII